MIRKMGTDRWTKKRRGGNWLKNKKNMDYETHITDKGLRFRIYEELL